MGACSGITRKGARCTLSVPPGAEWCYNHDPQRQGERKRNAAKGGKAKANPDLQDIKTRLRNLADGVLTGAVDKGVGAVVATIWGVYLRAVSTELAVKEQLELVERMENLEAAIAANREDRSRWHA